MTQDPRLNALLDLSKLTKELRLAELAKAAAEKAEVENALLALGDTQFSGSSSIPDAVAFTMHETWRSKRRRVLNQILAQKTAKWLMARDDAHRAFGQNEVLAKLARKT